MSCQNTSILLQETEEAQAVPLRNTSPIPLASGGLRLPPFPARKRDETNPNEAPKSFMTDQEASELKGFIFAQLHEFDELVNLYDQ
jgi:serine/threonine-protein phosphatase 4 regulatory subunit 2